MRTLSVAAMILGADAVRNGEQGGWNWNPYNMARAGGLVALGTLVKTANAVHPTYHAHMNEQAHLLNSPCTATSCPMTERFHAFALEEGKPYAMPVLGGSSGQAMARPGYESHFAARERVFAENVGKMYEKNTNSDGSYVFGINKFADETWEEFAQHRLGLTLTEADQAKFSALPKEPTSSARKGHFMTHAKASGKKDWAEDGYTTDIKDQGQCGSCWAHSAVEQVESMLMVKGLVDSWDPYVGSPQELTSCDDQDMGCNGGNPMSGFEFLEDHALEKESDYPYTSGDTQRTGQCKAKYSKGKYEVTGYTQVSDGAEGEDDLADYLLNSGPLSVAVDANDNWQMYVGGVMPASKCEGQLDHAVQAVGIDTEADKPYIKVRNSWGMGWGEEGHIRLAYGTNTCGIANMASTCDVQRADGKSSASSTSIRV